MSEEKLAELNFDTPMLKQYQEIKKNYQDTILFFRLGDFYEMFLDDAKTASKELDLTLTGRGKEENRVPMCGIPYHAANNYIYRLTNKGYKVAICEQVEDPRLAKGLTKREVVKIITPGTVLEPSALDEKEHNFLLAFMPVKDQGFAGGFIDVTTGDFFSFTVQDQISLESQIDHINAKEILLPENYQTKFTKDVLVTYFDPLEIREAEKNLIKFFKAKSLSIYGLDDNEKSLPSLWAIINYLKTNQKNALAHITKITPVNTKSMFLDQVTRKNLELTESLYKKDRKGTLFWALDETKTAMGARNLKQLLKTPLLDLKEINNRLDALEELKVNFTVREEIRAVLNKTPDFERMIARIVLEENNPRDLLSLKEALLNLKNISPLLNKFNKSCLLQEFNAFFAEFEKPDSQYLALIDLIEKSIVENAPALIKDGNFIKESFSPELKELKESFQNIKEWLQTLEDRERVRTNIKSLKVGYNKIFGYYIEIYKSYEKSAPPEYIRKQTLVNAERYITPELKEKESVLLNGEEKQKQLEIKIFKDLLIAIKAYILPIQHLAKIISHLDLFQALATVAQKYDYVRPEFVDSKEKVLAFKESRHPVLERNLNLHFIPNDLEMNAKENRFILITGPNMAGKSTLMRQIALSVIMAQIGSFVPASQAKLSLVDKLFTRIGALDNLYFGHSTYMVEMLETASILNNATEASLIILDEVGRGTSTFDGMSIACSISEYIHNAIKARTLFATHYHEITVLEKQLLGFSNFHMEIMENNGSLVFKYKFNRGQADKSYGVHVAEMAGLPKKVIDKAKVILAGFEEQGINYLQYNIRAEQLSLF